MSVQFEKSYLRNNPISKFHILAFCLFIAFFENIAVHTLNIEAYSTPLFKGIYALFILLWLEKDSSEYNYRRSIWLWGATMAVPEIFFLVYFYKTRGMKGAIKATCYFILFVILFIFLNIVGDAVYSSVQTNSSLIDEIVGRCNHW